MLRFMVALTLAFMVGQDGDKLKARHDELAAALKTAKTAEGLTYVAEQFAALAEDAVKYDEYDLALRALEQASKSAKAAKNESLATQCVDRAAQAKRIASEHAKAKSAFKALQDRPNDAAAHLAAGRFLCFVKGNWADGLDHLSKGSDEPLRGLALRDRFAQTIEDTEALIGMGDDWWPKSRERAYVWYTSVWPRLNPLQREKVRPRLRELLTRTPANKKPQDYPMAAAWSKEPKFQATVDDTYAYAGKKSLRVEAGAFVLQRRDWTGGGKLIFSAQVLTADGSDAGGFQLQLWDAFGKYTKIRPAGQPDCPFWAEVRAPVDIPAGTVAVTVGIYTGPTTKIWVDDISLRDEATGREVLENGSFEK